MTAEQLTATAGVILSLAFSYIPGLKAWFEQFGPEQKRAIMGLLTVGVAAAVLGIACAGFAADLGLGVTCDRLGIVGILQALAAALVANQVAYKFSPDFSKSGAAG